MNVLTGIRVAVRTWRKAPALAVAIVLTLALTVGGTTTAFTIAYSTLVQAFPFPDAERLVWVTTFDRRTQAGDQVIDSNRIPLFADWERNLTSFEQVGAWAGRAPDVFTVTGDDIPERLSGLRVTHQLLPMLGAEPALGRLFGPADDRPAAPQTVVLSHDYWQHRFAGRPDVLGRIVTIENVPHTITGVLPAEFPLAGSLFAGAPIDLYLPLTIDGTEDIGGFMAVIGRLRTGVTVDAARAELASRQAALSSGPWQWMQVLGQQVTPLPELVTRDLRSPVLLLFAGVGGLLLMACANLANLLLVRATGRRREIQVRAALGASIGTLFRQITVENALLVATGGAAGVVLAAGAIEVLERATSLPLARVGELRVGWPVVGFTAGLCGVITLMFSGVALLQLRARDLMHSLRPYGGSTVDLRAVTVQRLALATQVAMVVVLVVAGGLLVRSLTKLLAVDPGFDPRGAIAMRVDPAGRLAGPARMPFFTSVLERVRSLPGVDAAALTIHVPMGDRPSMGWDAIPEGQKTVPSADAAAGRIVSPGYFATAGVQVIEGRDFHALDVRDNPYVMAINETFARRIRAEGKDPLGQRFLVLGNLRQVVSVVADVRHRSLDGAAGREVYIPMAQAPGFFQSYDLIVRSATPIGLVPAIRAAIWEIDRNQAIGTPVALEAYIDRTLLLRRLLTVTTGVLAASALLLALCGVYGVVGYRVAQRTREIAIRVALGSPGWRLTATVAGDTALSVAAGFALGLPLALGAAAAIRSQLFGVEPRDGVTLATACAVVVTGTLAAAYLPARRAPRVDPIAALRLE